MTVILISGLAGGGLGIALGYFIGRFRTRHEIKEGIRRGVEHDAEQARFTRQQAMLRNQRSTARRPEHEDDEPSRIGRVDLDPPR